MEGMRGGMYCCLVPALTLWGVLNLCARYITDSAYVTDLKKAKGLKPHHWLV